MLSSSGNNVTLECVAFGEPVPKTSWRRTDGALKNDRSLMIAAGLRIVDIRASDEGSYVCEISNGVPPAISYRISLFVQGKNGSILYLTSETSEIPSYCS